MPPDPSPPALGRPSAASTRPGLLRASADASSASYRADGGDSAQWSVRAASVAGVRHRLAGRGPEDAYAWSVITTDGSETVVLAVADGVGSVEGSAAAAQAAVTAACAAVTPDGPWPDVAWPDVFAAADAAVVEAGGATTLVVAVIGADGRGAVARTGDSTALLLDCGRWIEVWPPPPVVDDRPISTATAALPVRSGSAADISVAAVDLGVGTAVVLVTDGIVGPLRDGPTTVAPALADGLATVPSPLGLAVLTDFSRQGCFDDRTVIALWSRPDEPPVSDEPEPASDTVEDGTG